MIVDLPGKNYTQFSLQGLNLITDQPSGELPCDLVVLNGGSVRAIDDQGLSLFWSVVESTFMELTE